MSWFRKLLRRPDTTELDNRVQEAKRERDEVAAMRPETNRIARSMDDHITKNHFGDRIEAAFRAAGRGRPA